MNSMLSLNVYSGVVPWGAVVTILLSFTLFFLMCAGGILASEIGLGNSQFGWLAPLGFAFVDSSYMTYLYISRLLGIELLCIAKPFIIYVYMGFLEPLLLNHLLYSFWPFKNNSCYLCATLCLYSYLSFSCFCVEHAHLGGSLVPRVILSIYISTFTKKCL